LSARRSLPTICVHMCSVARVSFHSASGSAGHASSFESPEITGSLVIRPPGPPNHLAQKVGTALDFHVVDVAPSPVLSRLERLHDRVVDGTEVLRRVFVFRTVAASDVPTGETQPEMHPFITSFQAFLASVCARRHFSDFIQVPAGGGHGGSSSNV